MNPTYVDSNVLVFAFGDASHPRRLGARRTLERASGEGPLLTSVLTVDEFLWARQRESGVVVAVEDTRSLLGLPVLRLVAVEPAHAKAAVDLVEEHGLRPRDAFHLAVAQARDCGRLLSDDSDFDGIPGIKRTAP